MGFHSAHVFFFRNVLLVFVYKYFFNLLDYLSHIKIHLLGEPSYCEPITNYVCI